MKGRLFGPMMATGILIMCASGSAIDDPDFFEKPPSWTSLLATNSGDFIRDDELAEWVKTAQDYVEQNDPWLQFRSPLHVLFSLTQCYSGGFLTEIRDAGVRAYGANASCGYFQSCSYDAPGQPGGSFYAYQWRQAAHAHTDWTDFQITTEGWKMVTVVNTLAGQEVAQYLSEGGPTGLPPEQIGSVCKDDYAILYVGRPDELGRDQTDTTNIFTTLVNVYGFDPENILILYGDGSDPNAIEATGDNLRKALTEPDEQAGGWLIPRLPTLPLPKFCSAQLFIWTGDHGAIQTPMTFSVDSASQGAAGSEMSGKSAQCGGACVSGTLWEGGTGTNAVGWRAFLHADWLDGWDLNAVSFGYDFVPPSETPGVYFSVDRESIGVVGSGVAQGGNGAAADVYSRTRNSNRQMTDGETSMGLQALIFVPDDLNALSMLPISTFMNPITGKPLVPVFFSVEGNAVIWVYDPLHDDIYSFLDLGGLLGVADVNALALQTPFVRVNPPPNPPPNNVLAPVPGFTRVLFSVARNDPLAQPNSVYRFDGVTLDEILDAGKLGLINTAEQQDDVNAMSAYGGNGPTLCPWDLTGDGIVGINDFLILLAQWGTLPGGPPDFAGDGVGLTDLLLLLANWGPCP